MKSVANKTQIERIKLKLRLVKNIDCLFQTFGAKDHKYKLGEPATLDEVRAFEEKHNIDLPQEYVDFVTQIGCGINFTRGAILAVFAGPYYGIRDFRAVNFCSNYIDGEPSFDETITQKQWEEIYQQEDEDDDEEWERLWAKFQESFAGMLTISHMGCSGYVGLIVNGKNRGRIISYSDEMEFAPIFEDEVNFLDWYEAWLDKVVSGNSFLHDYTFGDTEEALFQRYRDVEKVHKEHLHTYWKLVALNYIRGLKSLSDSAKNELWSILGQEKDLGVRISLLNILVKFDYEKTIPLLKELQEVDPQAFLRNLYLFARERIADWQDDLLLMEQKTEDEELREFVNFVRLRKP